MQYDEMLVRDRLCMHFMRFSHRMLLKYELVLHTHASISFYLSKTVHACILHEVIFGCLVHFVKFVLIFKAN